MAVFKSGARRSASVPQVEPAQLPAPRRCGADDEEGSAAGVAAAVCAALSLIAAAAVARRRLRASPRPAEPQEEEEGLGASVGELRSTLPRGEYKSVASGTAARPDAKDIDV